MYYIYIILALCPGNCTETNKKILGKLSRFVACNEPTNFIHNDFGSGRFILRSCSFCF
jgi:hypothetical protein